MERLVKPRLRGVSHQWAFFVALVAGVTLVIAAPSGRATFAATIYAISVAAMFGASALYHRIDWKSLTARRWMRRLDHSMIFFLIAGTYTPFALLGLHGAMRWLVLAMAWAGAALGLALELAWIDSPRWLSAAAYLLVGWVGVLTVPQLFSGMGIAVAVLLIVGGGVYTLGAVIYATKWPDPFPRIFGFHEVFHLLVVVAAVIQFVAVSLVVM
jgi:hemolysin III